MSEFRTDPLFGTLSIIARERAARPHRNRVREEVDNTGLCPLCPGNESHCPPEIARVESAPGKWLTRVFPNRYPSLSLEAEPGMFAQNAGADRPFSTFPGFGIHEVLVESPNHSFPFWNLDSDQVVPLFTLIQDRVKDLHRDRRIQYVQIFKNHRAGSGASLDHPHLQLLGLPFVPENLQKLTQAAHCKVCDLLGNELQSAEKKSERYLTETSRFVALMDFAPEFAYQFSIYPKAHVSAFEDATREELEELSHLFSLVLGKFSRILGEFPLNLVLFNEPNPKSVKDGDSRKMHWFARVYPRLAKHAGFELSTGIAVIHHSPEDAARAFTEKPL